jgi:hypothetical protein
MGASRRRRSSDSHVDDDIARSPPCIAAVIDHPSRITFRAATGPCAKNEAYLSIVLPPSRVPRSGHAGEVHPADETSSSCLGFTIKVCAERGGVFRGLDDWLSVIAVVFSALNAIPASLAVKPRHGSAQAHPARGIGVILTHTIPRWRRLLRRMALEKHRDRVEDLQRDTRFLGHGGRTISA